MGSESSFWNTIKKNMSKYWVADRVENPIMSGTPDVYYTMKSPFSMGWIELKHAHTWPKRETTILRLDHYTAQQKAFIRRHGSAGANVKLFLQVKTDYLLFDWESALHVGSMTKRELLEICLKSWSRSVDYNALRYFLTR